MLVHVGIGVCSVEAFAIGGTSLPSPGTETDYPPRGWLYLASSLCYRAVGAGPIDIVRFAEFQADLRAMRKVDKGVLFLTVVNSAALGASFTIGISGRVRALCLT